jgi:hypothetical protein
LTNPQRQLDPLPLIQDNIEVLEIDDSFSRDFAQDFALRRAKRITLAEARQTLQKIENATGIKPALIYAVFVPGSITPVPASDKVKVKSLQVNLNFPYCVLQIPNRAIAWNLC